MSENPAWRCGHPRTPENTRGTKCRQCDDAYQQAYRGSTAYQTNYRMRLLPPQLDRARRRVVHLEREAARLGLHNLLSSEYQA